jgi:hypothetical protein
MKRRKFIQNLGLSVPPLLIQHHSDVQGEKKAIPEYNYQQPHTLQEAVTREGQIIIRLEFRSGERDAVMLKPEIRITNGNILRTKNYFFERGEDNFTGDIAGLTFLLAESDTDVLVLWFDRFSKETSLTLMDNRGTFSFALSDIVNKTEVTGIIGKTNIKANFLLDREIGELNPEEVGIKNPGADFSFLLMADPQGGDATRPNANLRMKVHNAFVEESIKLAGKLKAVPLFCLMVGDIVDEQGEAEHFVQMAKFFEKLNMPVLYGMGNHESRYRTEFWPGYNLSGFNNYFAAQKALNGMEKLLYSFNLGKWHFVVWPDPLRSMFWENHPHYFDWLERDLEKYKDRPTLFFQHVPMHPVGINPLINYCEPPHVKRLLVDILSKHGNVKTIFSGHVHIPVKSSFKTACEIKGMNFINLPATGYRPRSFGEEDYSGGPAQGLCIVDIKGDKMAATYKSVTLEEYVYPEKLPPFEDEKYPLWFLNKWELSANRAFINGNFEDGLKGWGRRYVYQEDEFPANICEVRIPDSERFPALYLKTEKRGYHIPGQDRLPQDINRLFQAIELQQGEEPVIRFDYLLDGKNCDFTGFNGLYIWVEGFRKSARLINLLYFANKAWINLGTTYSRSAGSQPLFFSLDNSTGRWHDVQLSIKADFETNPKGFNYFSPEPDRLVVSAGIWNINDGRKQPFAAFLKNFRIDYSAGSVSQINGKALEPVPDEKKWWRGKYMRAGNVAGEHHYHVEGWEELKY